MRAIIFMTSISTGFVNLNAKRMIYLKVINKKYFTAQSSCIILFSAECAETKQPSHLVLHAK